MAVKQTYTSGNWLVQEGKEEEFMRRWKEFAQWSAKNTSGSGDFYLIQETANPRHFLSFGSWENPEAVNSWRQTPEFKDFIGGCKQLCEDFKAGDYTLRVSSED
ncbi:MAG: antibiotic biosynthesis monooxygenase family protein [Candidatus Saccharimonadales bacterium]